MIITFARQEICCVSLDSQSFLRGKAPIVLAQVSRHWTELSWGCVIYIIFT